MRVTLRIVSLLAALVCFCHTDFVAEQTLFAQETGRGGFEQRVQDQNDRKQGERSEAEQRAAEEGARRAIAIRQDDEAKGIDFIEAGDVDAVATGLNPVPEKVVPVWAIHNVTYSPDGSTLVAGLGTGDIHVWSLEDQKLAKYPKIHLEWTFATVFDSEGKTIFSAGGDNQLHRWSGPDFTSKVQSYVGHTGDIHALAVTKDHRFLVSAGDDMTPIVWDVESGKEIRRLATHPRQIPAIALSPDGSKVATACRDGKIRTFALDTGELLLAHQGHEGDALSVRFTEDGSRLVSGGYDGVVTIYDADMGHLVLKTNATDEAIVCVDVSRDSRSIIVATNEEIIRCEIDGDQVTKTVFKAELAANEQFSFVRYSPDEKAIAASTTGQQIFVLDEELKTVMAPLRDPDFKSNAAGEDQ